jgi:hypothetical protein
MSIKIYRIQDKEGRGPFKPGFSHNWSSMSEEDMNKYRPNEFMSIAGKLKLKGSNDSYGFGFRSFYQLSLYFTVKERFKLYDFGYFVARMKIDKIIAESASQILFWRDKPLSEDYQIYQSKEDFSNTLHSR